MLSESQEKSRYSVQATPIFFLALRNVRYWYLSLSKQGLSFLRRCEAALPYVGLIGLIRRDLLTVLHPVWHMVSHRLGVGVATGFTKDGSMQRITLCILD